MKWAVEGATVYELGPEYLERKLICICAEVRYAHVVANAHNALAEVAERDLTLETTWTRSSATNGGVIEPR